MDIPKTLGALLIGAFFATLFSGGVVIQTLLYLKLYPSDPPRLKALVCSFITQLQHPSSLDPWQVFVIWSVLFSGTCPGSDLLPSTLQVPRYISYGFHLGSVVGVCGGLLRESRIY
ncbi:hypothetical protein VNI00_004450 [Paramarasmius palmivorus]|uniref:Peptidase S54 rhomboid domain-containing protein n=1 Tax=Paramarasmius palmivorus TaxID=297713 RepID=A0AAW0DFB3_9AGAR